MKSYILSIVGAVLISSVAAIIAPSGKTGTFIKGVTKLLVLSVLVAPFVSLFTGKGFEVSSAKSRYALDESYLQACAELSSEADEREIAAYIQKEFAVESEVFVSRDGADPVTVKKVVVKITDFGISAEDEHIDIAQRIRTDLTNRYGCEVEVS